MARGIPPTCLPRWTVTFTWSLQTRRLTERTCEFYVPLFVFFSNCFLNLSALLFDKGFYHRKHNFLGKAPPIPVGWCLSSRAGAEQAAATSLLVLPATLRLWKNCCEPIHLGSAWDLLWQIYWLLNLYPSRTSEPIYSFPHSHSREREHSKKGGGSTPLTPLQQTS